MLRFVALPGIVLSLCTISVCNYLVAHFSEKGKKGIRNVYFFHCNSPDISVSRSFLVRRIARGPVTGNEVEGTNIYTVHTHSPIQFQL
jgi:hypothetical protein